MARADLRPEVRRRLSRHGSAASPASIACTTLPAALIYVGKARNLRRRLAQYRTVPSDEEGSQASRAGESRPTGSSGRSARRSWRPRSPRSSSSRRCARRATSPAPFHSCIHSSGSRSTAADTRFCLTTSPEAFAAFDLHGAFRSREITREAFFALMRLLRLVAHPTARRPRDRLRVPRTPTSTRSVDSRGTGPQLWNALLRGASRRRAGTALSTPARPRCGSRPRCGYRGRPSCRGALLRRRGVDTGRGDRDHRVRRLPRTPGRPRRALPALPRRY